MPNSNEEIKIILNHLSDMAKEQYPQDAKLREAFIIGATEIIKLVAPHLK